MKKIIIMSFALFSTTVFAGGDLDKQAYQLSLYDGSIDQQRAVIEKKITQIEYIELTNENRTAMFKHLDFLRQNGASDQKAVNAQQAVNEILFDAFSDSKIVCKYDTALGTNMKKRSCMTLAAQKRIYEKTQKDLQMQHKSDVQRVN